MSGVLLFYSKFDRPDEWIAHLTRADPALEIRVWPDIGDPSEVDYALVWKPPQGFFAQFPNLRLVINLGAGIDALAGRDDLPDLPIMRLSDPDMTGQMVAYCVGAVLRHARDFDLFERDTRAGQWVYRHPRRCRDVRVGVLGLGELGQPVAQALAGLGFAVSGWARSARELPGIATFAGQEAFEPFLSGLDIAVSLLPATPATRGIFNARAFAVLPRGACFVNASRGSVVDEEALVAALRSGHLRGATLDTFVTEPLPAEHPLWQIETVLITPHLASVAGPEGSAPEIVANIARLRAGQPLLHLADPRRGY